MREACDPIYLFKGKLVSFWWSSCPLNREIISLDDTKLYFSTIRSGSSDGPT